MSNQLKKNIIITKPTQKRLIKDIVDLIKEPLTDQGIYYIHDEANILKGYAMIIGPSETLYSDGFFFFSFHFPYNYPFAPPKVIYQTNGDNIRFHPNLYKNGKCCLSMLNTWKGEQWTSCQTIKTILLTLVTLFNNKPLLGEPGFKETSSDFIPYNKIIEYKVIDIAILDVFSKHRIPAVFFSFYTFIKKHFEKEYKNIMNRIEKKIEKLEGSMEHCSVSVYKMEVLINYSKLKEKMEKIEINK